MPKRIAKPQPLHEPTELRIIGGQFRGSKLLYHGDPVTRPMKERVRESLFNLISTECRGKHAFDLFAGTGALGIEALSRGAESATFIEKHIPTARVVEQNIAALALEDRTELLMTSAFLWGKRDLPKTAVARMQDATNRSESPSIKLPPVAKPWLVFCSPPYSFFVDQQTQMLELINAVLEYCPTGSILLVEADERFDFGLLPGGLRTEKRGPGWDVRTYPPAVVGVWRT
ncbi:MAG: RsmD family RNA methyltransferase [Planctomycetota bacterium]